MVPRRAAEPRLEPLALPLPAGASSRTATWWPRTAAAASSTPSTSCSTPASFDDDRYWIVEVDYAKADPHDLLMTVRVTNAGPEADDAARAADRLVPQHVGVGRSDAPNARAASVGGGATS